MKNLETVLFLLQTKYNNFNSLDFKQQSILIFNEFEITVLEEELIYLKSKELKNFPEDLELENRKHENNYELNLKLYENSNRFRSIEEEKLEC